MTRRKKAEQANPTPLKKLRKEKVCVCESVVEVCATEREREGRAYFFLLLPLRGEERGSSRVAGLELRRAVAPAPPYLAISHLVDSFNRGALFYLICSGGGAVSGICLLVYRFVLGGIPPFGFRRPVRRVFSVSPGGILQIGSEG